MKKLQKPFLVVLAIFVLLMSMCFSAYATADTIPDEIQKEEIVRASEHLVVKSRTELWKYLPYSTINNTIMYYLSAGDTLNYLSYHTDVYGNGWWKAQVINCAASSSATGATGYISASTVSIVIG